MIILSDIIKVLFCYNNICFESCMLIDSNLYNLKLFHNSLLN